MKQNILASLIVFFFLNFHNKGFSQEMNCATTTPIQSQENMLAPCFDVEELLKDCEEGKSIYMRVNLHYFTNDDCTGNLQISGTTQEAAYKHADDFIKAANEALANNQRQWGVASSVAPCNPLRYVLSGVHIHCKSNANGGNVHNLHQNYGVNKQTEINYYIANYPGNTTGQGFATYGVIDWITTGNFNHELGHTFSLDHSWYNDLLTDTPELVYDWDKNCDGEIKDLDTNGDGIKDHLENDRQCWNIIEDGATDTNINGIYDCIEVAPCTIHPCCSWDNINNNVMAYNAFENAYTSQQITKLLTHIANDSAKCHMIETISNCPPPKAIIGQTPFTLQYDNPCNECIYFSASSNDTKFKYDLYENGVGGRVCILTQSWQTRESDKFCYGIGKLGSPNKLKPNTSYTIKLVVENNCGDTEEVEYTFTTGIECRMDIPTEQIPGYPNPSDDTYRINYNSGEEEIVNIQAFHSLTGALTTLITNYQLNQGNNEINLDISNLSNGSNFIIIAGGSIYLRSQVLKI